MSYPNTIQILIRGKCIFSYFIHLKVWEPVHGDVSMCFFNTYFNKQDMILREAISNIIHTMIHCRLWAPCIVLSDFIYSLFLVLLQFVIFASKEHMRWMICWEVGFTTLLSVWRRRILNEFASMYLTLSIFSLILLYLCWCCCLCILAWSYSMSREIGLLLCT